ncbi:hypothetical protein N0V82_010335 [Gnomoniopsis sp. IMI 355080]|nr:hypothetical protein N0V82_010335 [Gnomoniopsis sp. IMI 355080]
MTGLSFYNTYVLHWSAGLASLDAILTKAEAHAKENGIDADAKYVNASIYDDMKPLSFQVQIVAAAVKMPLDNLIGKAPEWTEELKTFADLHARVKSAQEYLNSVKPEAVDGREDEVVTALGPFSSHYPNGVSIKVFCDMFSIPNLYFHLVTAYDILRKEGVPLGKMDYLGPFLPKDK